MGILPTGKRDRACHHRFANGQGVEAWSNDDDLDLLQQLGVVPSMEKEEE